MIKAELYGINSKKRTLVVRLPNCSEQQLLNYRCTDKVWRYITDWGWRKGRRWVHLCLNGDCETVYHIGEY